MENRIRFFTIGLVLTAVAGVATLLSYQHFIVVPSYRDSVVSMVEGQAVKVVHHLLVGFEVEADGSLAKGMRDHLERHLKEGVDSLGLAKIKVFDSGGKVLLSSDEEEAGSYNRSEYFHDLVAAGKKVAKLVRREGRSPEGRSFSRDIVETYVPIVHEGVFAGAFELSYDVTAVVDDLGGTNRRTTLSLLGIAAFFTAVILILAFRSRSAVRKQQVVEAALQEAKEGLEAQVRERTEELAAGNLRLMELDNLKSMFIASMSHELRTPLNAILGFTGIMLQGMTGPLNEEQRRQLKMVSQNGDHLLKLVNDIIDMSAVESGRLGPNLEEFDLTRMLMEVRESFAALAAGRGIGLTLEAAASLPVRSDRRRLRQVMNNLVDNALRFTGGGSVSITAEPKGDAVLVTIADTGSGIAGGELERIFEPFRKIRAGRAEDHEGAGLGLYLCRRIVGMLGCSLDVESEVGKGTTFFLVVRNS